MPNGDRAREITNAERTALERMRDVASFVAIAIVFVNSFQLCVLASPRDTVLACAQTRVPLAFAWAKFMTKTVMKCALVRCRESADVCRERDVMYLCNHRAWADFFVDVYATEGRAFTMSRMLVACAFPLFMLPAMFVGAVFGFNRDGVQDKERLNAALDGHFERFRDVYGGAVVYPEGTRNIRDHSLPLKRGMLRYAHGRKMRVQCVCIAGKERVFSSHLLSAKRGLTLPIYFSQVVRADEHDDFEDFYNEVRAKWDDAWSNAYGVREEDLRALAEYEPKERLVKASTRADVVAAGGALFTIACVALACVCALRVAQRLY